MTLNPKIVALAAADVDADIARGVVSPERRDEKIARRADKFAITIVRDAWGYSYGDHAITVGLSYGGSTNGGETYFAPGDDRPLMVFSRKVFGEHTDEDVAFVQNAVKAIQRAYGDELPIRVNRYARPTAISAGLIEATPA